MSAVMDPPKILKGNPGVMVPMQVKTPAGEVVVQVAPEVAAEPLKFAKLIEEQAEALYEELRKQQEAQYEIQYSIGTVSLNTAPVPVPAREMLVGLKQQALEWVNAIRTEYGFPALDQLPAGLPGNSKECVLARALPHAVSVGGHVLLKSGARLLPPVAVRQFVGSFDLGHYPELVA